MDDKNPQINSANGATPRWDEVQLPDSAGQLPTLSESVAPEPRAVSETPTDETPPPVDPQRSIFRTRLSSAARFAKRDQPAEAPTPVIEVESEPPVALVEDVAKQEVVVPEVVVEPEPIAATPIAVEPVAAPAVSEVGNTTIAINISLPELTKLKPLAILAWNITLKLSRAVLKAVQAGSGQIIGLARGGQRIGSKLPWKVVTAGLAGCLVAVGLVLGGLQLWHHKSVAGAGAGSGATARASVGSAVSRSSATAAAGPKFNPAVPESKPQLATVHTGTSSFEPKHNVYSYSDSLRNNGIIVSEQPIPSNFSSNEQALTTVAKSLNATQSVTVGSTKAMIATNSKSNSQTVVYVYQDLLIFIQSPFTHTSPDWQAYLSSLKEQ